MSLHAFVANNANKHPENKNQQNSIVYYPNKHPTEGVDFVSLNQSHP